MSICVKSYFASEHYNKVRSQTIIGRHCSPNALSEFYRNHINRVVPWPHGSGHGRERFQKLFEKRILSYSCTINCSYELILSKAGSLRIHFQLCAEHRTRSSRNQYIPARSLKTPFRLRMHSGLSIGFKFPALTGVHVGPWGLFLYLQKLLLETNQTIKLRNLQLA